MVEDEQPGSLTRDHLYCVGTSATLRWQGIKGKEVLVEVATYDAPHVTIQSWKGKQARIEFPVADIVRLRAGVEYMQTARYRCVIVRRGAANITLIGTLHRYDYRELVLHLAEEMRGIGHFDRVERGLNWWENLVYLTIFGGLALVLCYVPYDSWVRYGANWDQEDRLKAAGLGLLAVLLLLYTLWIWYGSYRARRVRDLDDLAAIL